MLCKFPLFFSHLFVRAKMALSGSRTRQKFELFSIQRENVCWLAFVSIQLVVLPSLREKSTKTKRKSLRVVALSHVNSFGEIFYYIFHSTSSFSRTTQFHSSPSRPRARRPRPAPMLCCRATPKATRSRAFSGRRTTTRWNTQIAFISPRTIKHWILTTLRSRMRDYMLA